MGTTTLAMLFIVTSQSLGLPEGLLNAICHIESNHNIRAVSVNDGGSASLGVCQIKLATASLLGFKGSAESLRRPDVNVHYAGLYLRHQLDRYDGDIRKAVSAYNAGKHRVNAKGEIMNRKYVVKVLKQWGNEL
jgi:soluble lytic murein transglycosylase-like protein